MTTEHSSHGTPASEVEPWITDALDAWGKGDKDFVCNNYTRLNPQTQHAIIQGMLHTFQQASKRGAEPLGLVFWEMSLTLIQKTPDKRFLREAPDLIKVWTEAYATEPLPNRPGIRALLNAINAPSSQIVTDAPPIPLLPQP